MSTQSRAISTLSWAVAFFLSVFVSNAAAQVVTVDNVDAGFTILSGTWDTGSFPTPNGADYRWVVTSGFDPGEPYSEVEWRPSLPSAGLYEVEIWYVEGTNRAFDAEFVVHHVGGPTPVTVNQQVNGSTWFSLGTYDFGAGAGGSVTLDNDAAANVVIADAVRFSAVGGATVDLTMAVASNGTGSTAPANGMMHTQLMGADVAISASPTAGYAFDHWEVSAGAAPASPTSAVTTVNMDQSKTVTAHFASVSGTPSFRAFWADAFHSGYKSTAQIDQMVAMAVAGNYNAVIPEVLAYHDDVGSGHGAYWNSSIIPKASDISGGIDPLAYLVQEAHAAGLEVHCWLVAFRVSTSWPPSGNAIMTAHPEWIMVPSGDMGGGPATVDGKYTLDPGSPEVQAYLASIVSELVNNYDIDGIHWDYIRYTSTDAGYPSDTSYANSGLERFQRLTGRVDVPSVGDAQWNDFRRRSVTEVVRQAMTVMATADNPRQPLRHTAALITWGDAPASFTSASAYAIFQNWREWMELGYLDAGIPMTYYREYNPPHDQWYRNWVDASLGWRYDRHIFTGPGVYLNSFADSITQMNYALSAGVDGLSSYSYAVTNNLGQTSTDWYPYVASNLFTSAVATPNMPWREPANATEGFIHGRVTDGATGQPIDDAMILLGGADSGVRTDGNGYYLLTQVPAGAGGSIISVGASSVGFGTVTRPSVLVERAGFTECNLALGAWAFGDYDVDGDVDLGDHAEFADCLIGPDVSPPAGCDVFDVDADDDVDLDDWSEFAVSFTG